MFRADFPSTKVNLGTFFVGLAKGLRKKKQHLISIPGFASGEEPRNNWGLSHL
jgi:hypothetical protein